MLPHMTTSTRLVDLYLRLSVDREGKDSLERQEADLRAWADREGLQVRKVWKDAGLSGYRKDVVREDFDSAVAAVARGEVGTLAVWKLDRLSRRGAGQVGQVLDDVEEVGGRIYFLRDSLDSTVPGHRMVIVMVSEQARAESANTSLRVKDKIAKDAAKGIPKGGTRSFGWEADGMTLRESEAVRVRQAVADVLAGSRSMIQVAKDWNEAGVRTDGMSRERKGRDGVVKAARGYWTATTVRQLLLRDRNAGILIHQGVEMPESRIEPIVSRDELEALKSRVKVGTPVGARAKTLLGGLLRCECGAPMHHTVSYSQRKGGPRREYFIYKCSETVYDRTQKHASVQTHIADTKVTAAVLANYAAGTLKPEANADSSRLGEIGAQLAEVNAQELRAEDALVEGLGDARRLKGRLAALATQRAELTAERERLQADAAGGGALALFEQAMSVVGAPEVGDLASELVAAYGLSVWQDLGLEAQQSIIRGRFSLQVRLGGRGAERVEVELLK